MRVMEGNHNISEFFIFALLGMIDLQIILMNADELFMIYLTTFSKDAASKVSHLYVFLLLQLVKHAFEPLLLLKAFLVDFMNIWMKTKEIRV